MHETPIVFAFDTQYATPVAVTLASLVQNSSVDLDIRCISSKLSFDQEDAIMRSLQHTNSCVKFHPAPESDFFGWKTSGYLSTATYWRLMIPRMIESQKALYLDGDVIVTCDVAPLLETSLEGKLLAGCHDRGAGESTAMPVDVVSPYINAGVLLMNLKEMRENNFTEICIEEYNKNKEIATYDDQCIINACSRGRKSIVHQKWNVLISTIMQDNPDVPFKSVLEYAIGRSIIHVCGVVKPWMEWCDPWLTDLWLQYARLAFGDVTRLVRKPSRPLEFIKLHKTLSIQERWQEDCAVLEICLKHFKSLTGLRDTTLELEEANVWSLEARGCWQTAAILKERVFILYVEKARPIK